MKKKDKKKVYLQDYLVFLVLFIAAPFTIIYGISFINYGLGVIAYGLYMGFFAILMITFPGEND